MILWIFPVVAIIFGAIASDMVNGVRAKGTRAGYGWYAFWAGFFLGPFGLILAMMMRAEILSERRRQR